jgi:hypothetical protein
LASKRRAKNNKRDRVTNGKVAHDKAGVDNAGNGNATNDKLEALQSFRKSGADELLTTNHGTRINDNQNSLTRRARADRRSSRTSSSARRSPTSTTSGFPSAWCTRVAPPRTVTSRSTVL